MELYERLRAIAERIPSIRDKLQTEEATKTALIMPFIQALGYDVFNPNEVVPEFTADVGIKKGEKVDYAIISDGSPVILIECKSCGASLENYSSQLYRYFTTTAAKIGILTDGICYRFFTDLRETNKMDNKPFMEINLLDIRESLVVELGKLVKTTLDIDLMLDSASNLKYSNEFKSILSREMEQPSDGFVRFFAEHAYDGRLTQNVIERFRAILKKALSDYFAIQVDKRLKAALDKNKQVEDDTSDGENTVDNPPDETEVETTVEELEAFLAVKAILHDMVPARRITSRDVRSYFGVLLDDNNRKPICRFRFNGTKKYLGVFDREKNETRIHVQGAEGVFEHVPEIRQSVQYLLEKE